MKTATVSCMQTTADRSLCKHSLSTHHNEWNREQNICGNRVCKKSVPTLLAWIFVCRCPPWSRCHWRRISCSESCGTAATSPRQWRTRWHRHQSQGTAWKEQGEPQISRVTLQGTSETPCKLPQLQAMASWRQQKSHQLKDQTFPPYYLLETMKINCTTLDAWEEVKAMWEENSGIH